MQDSIIISEVKIYKPLHLIHLSNINLFFYQKIEHNLKLQSL